MTAPGARGTLAILGAGVTGCAAGRVSDADVFEAAAVPGGICSSYYLRRSEQPLMAAPPEDDAFRFELGGGHWIFGGDPSTLSWVTQLAPVRSYARKAAVYLPEENLFIPYPIQNNLRALGRERARQIVDDLRDRRQGAEPAKTMKNWLAQNFGQSLCELFFNPFHALYTAGLWTDIAPQDAYKTPIDWSQVVAGATEDTAPAGYNVQFLYPQGGLDHFCRQLARGARIHYERRVAAIEPSEKRLIFEDGSRFEYRSLLSTLPLNRTLSLAGVDPGERADPATAVLVLNIGAVRGERCPTEHWLYIPRSRSGFHRVGFYSNVDQSFLPRRYRCRDSHVSLYVERAYRTGQKPAAAEIERFTRSVCAELEAWEWIRDAEAIHPTWVDVAYTWSWPASRWRNAAMESLEAAGIRSVGRYGAWRFQGIADSIREGLRAGAAIY